MYINMGVFFLNKKKILFSSFLLPSILLYGCGAIDAEEEKMTSKVSQIESIYKKEGTYKIDSITNVNLTSSEKKDIVVVSNSNTNSKVEIFSYSDDIKNWSSVYIDKTHKNFDGLENLYLVDTIHVSDTQDNIVLGYSGGNSDTLNFKVLSFDKKSKKINVVLDKMLNEFQDSSVLFKPKKIVLKSSSETFEEFHWNGVSYEK